MPQQRLTDRVIAPYITGDTLIHIVNTGDTTQYAGGSSYKATIDQVATYISQNYTMFSGGSGNCITDLYVSNLYGCSPIIIHDNLVIESGVTITSTNGGGQIELDYALQPSNILISTDNGGVTEAFINLQPTDLNLGSLNGDVRIQSLNSNNFRSGNLFSNMSQILMEPDFVKIGVVDPSAVFSNDYESVVVYNTLSSDQATSNANKWPVTVSSKNSTILSGVRNSVILGGSDITASTNNTVYVDNLNINTVGNGTSVINLGLDSNGFVVTGTTFSGGSGNCITDLYISNIHSCSPLNINPLDEGNVYFGSTSGVTIDLANNRVGIGTLTPTQKLDVSGTSIFRDTVNMLTGTTILWQDKSSIFPTSVNNRIRWDLNSDSADIYAYQFLTTVDELNLVFKISDNNTTDSYVFWIDDFQGESFDAYPLQMDGQKAVFNALRRYATSATTSGAGNVDFYILRESATTLNDSAMFVDVSTGNVGIGTTSPSEKLDVSGKTKTTTLQITSGATNGYVLTSDASGNATWQASSGVFTGNTSASCISDLYVSNIHSCSPLNINPLDEGNVYFGSTSGVTIDLTNNRLGVGTDSPQYPLQVVGTNSEFYYDPISVGGLTILSGNTGIPRYGLIIPSYLLKPQTGGSVGIRSWSDVTYPGYGKVGDMFIYAGEDTNGLNIINQGPGINSEDYIRFYAGTQANISTADIHIQGSGSTKGYVGINTETPSERLDVNGKTKTINFQMTSGATSDYVLTSDGSGNASWQSMYGYKYYSAVTITSAQTLSIGSIPVQVLPAPGTNKYYDIKVYFEYVFNTTAYSSTGTLVLADNTTKRVTNQFDINGQLTSSVFVSDMNFQNQFTTLNSQIEFTTSDGSDPTLGDGSFKVKIYYNIIDFG